MLLQSSQRLFAGAVDQTIVVSHSMRYLKEKRPWNQFVRAFRQAPKGDCSRRHWFCRDSKLEHSSITAIKRDLHNIPSRPACRILARFLYLAGNRNYLALLLCSCLTYTDPSLSAALTDPTGNILMLSEGQPGVDNVFSLRDGMPLCQIFPGDTRPVQLYQVLQSPIAICMDW